MKPRPRAASFVNRQNLHRIVAVASVIGMAACGGSSSSTNRDASPADTASGGVLGKGGSGTGVGGEATAAGGHAGGVTGSAGGRGGSSSSGGISGPGGTIGSGGSKATGTTQCNDGLDNDGDGKIDLNDPECVSPLDDDEGTFATGIPGDNMDACKQDCFFDGNSGMGDDHCEWQLKCDSSNVGATAEKKCEYDPNASCPMSQPQACIDFCRPLTPNGCDCFGCCAVSTGASTISVRLTASCTAAKFGDPAACPPCTQTTTCINDCKPCELCLGKTTLPPECNTGAGGAGGSSGIECVNSVPCGTDQSICDKTGSLCISGCCVNSPS